MGRPAKFAVRFVIIVAVALSIPALLAPSAPQSSPYLSALSTLAVSQTLAAGTCNNKACVGGSRFNISCGQLTGFNCEKFGRNLCSDGAC